MVIEKKVWPLYFKSIQSGDKNFEVRLANWKCKKGDILILKEWNLKTKKYTGKIIKRKVTFVFKTKTQKFWSEEETKKWGLQIISFK